MNIKIGYFADGPWAHQAFEKIINDSTITIAFICVRYDQRDEVLISYAKQYQIDFFYDKNINSNEFIKKIQSYDIDLIVSMSFNQIFKSELLSVPPLKAINCHAGKLPFYRGRNILNWVLINDEQEFGITVHYIDHTIDTGDIILQKCYEITDEDNYATLLQRSYAGCADVLYSALKKIQNNDKNLIHQKDINEMGFYCGRRISGDEIIDWNQSSRNVFNFVRSICIPGPQATSYIRGKEIKINCVRMVQSRPYINTIGQIVGKTEIGFYVKTLDTVVEVIEFTYDGSIRIGDRMEKNV